MIARDMPRSDGSVKDVPSIGRVRFDTSFDIPWLCGSSIDINPKTGHFDVFGQRGIEFSKLIRGQRYDFALPYIVHELDERARNGSYTADHADAKRKERAWVQQHWPELGIETYDRLSNADISQAKRIAANCRVKVPPNLYRLPYSHPHNTLERKMYDEVFGKAA